MIDKPPEAVNVRSSGAPYEQDLIIMTWLWCISGPRRQWRHYDPMRG
jgi:hypothetical protein